MRLKLVKIVGFKSFVEPTRLVLPSDLVGIVGPNGCGKSNTLDAVRWVMGESSAKELRGGDMNDVLFNGTDSRKPVSQCSVELIFDNESGQASGPYANYAEISVKRQHHREDGTSYFLNGQRCRRRDVIELFQGTGLGPRSYALIGQGNITRIIEAKPADMRIYLEEVAGIGPYRSRRKETLARLAKTQENLVQLEVLQEALSDQSYNLERQAEKAQVFSNALAKRKQLEQNLYHHQWHSLHTKQQTTQAELRQAETNFSLTKANWDEKQKKYLLLRQELPDLQHKLDQAETNYHQLDKVKARLEQEEVFAQQQTSQWGTQEQVIQSQLEEYVAQQNLLTEQKAQETDELEAINYQLEDLYIKQENQDSQTLNQETQLKKTEQQLQQLHNKTLNQEQAFTKIKTEIQQQEQKLEHLLAQEKLIKETTSSDKSSSYLAEIAEIKEQIVKLLEQKKTLDQEAEKAQEQQTIRQEKLEEVQQELQELEKNENSYKAESQGLKSLLNSLANHETPTQQKAIAQEEQKSQATKILDSLEVELPWQEAVESWLGRFIEGLLVEDLAQAQSLEFAASLVGINPPGLNFAASSLATKIQQPGLIQALAQDIYCFNADKTLEEQLAPLPTQAWLIDKQGNLYNKFCVIKPSNTSAGILRNKERLGELEENIVKIQHLKPSLTEQEKQLKDDLILAQDHAKQAANQVSQLEKTLEQLSYKQDYLAQDIAAIDKQEIKFNQQQNQLSEAITATKVRLEELTADLITYEETLWQLEDQEEAAQEELQQLQNSLSPLIQEKAQLKSQVERLEQQQAQVKQQIKQLSFQEQQLAIQTKQAQKQLDLMQKNLADAASFNPAELEELSEKLLEAQAKLQDLKLKKNEFNLQLEQAEAESQQAQAQHYKTEQILNTSQVQLENMQENILNLQKTIVAAGINPHQLPQLELTDENPADMEYELKQVRAEISQLGSVNMNALKEFEEVTHKLKVLTEQITDLANTITSLEEAIATIDEDSRKRLQETFTQVNAEFSKLFPQLFNGGEASLSWENLAEDLLEDGVLIMARPPGKRNSRIQALSGGEKTLSALALIFAIFKLKPAPFCILDEVDAPLDDANVIRFSGLVRELSEKVQFIFITHNKTTMALAKHLIGVTMQEPGVSRLVSVDLDAAVDLIGEVA